MNQSRSSKWSKHFRTTCTHTHTRNTSSVTNMHDSSGASNHSKQTRRNPSGRKLHTHTHCRGCVYTCGMHRMHIREKKISRSDDAPIKISVYIYTLAAAAEENRSAVERMIYSLIVDVVDVGEAWNIFTGSVYEREEYCILCAATAATFMMHKLEWLPELDFLCLGRTMYIDRHVRFCKRVCTPAVFLPFIMLQLERYSIILFQFFFFFSFPFRQKIVLERIFWFIPLSVTTKCTTLFKQTDKKKSLKTYGIVAPPSHICSNFKEQKHQKKQNKKVAQRFLSYLSHLCTLTSVRTEQIQLQISRWCITRRSQSNCQNFAIRHRRSVTGRCSATINEFAFSLSLSLVAHSLLYTIATKLRLSDLIDCSPCYIHVRKLPLCCNTCLSIVFASGRKEASSSSNSRVSLSYPFINWSPRFRKINFTWRSRWYLLY